MIENNLEVLKLKKEWDLTKDLTKVYCKESEELLCFKDFVRMSDDDDDSVWIETYSCVMWYSSWNTAVFDWCDL